MGAFGDAIRRALVLNFVTGRENTAENARAAGLASAEAVDFLETLVRVGKNLKGTVSPPSQALGVDGDTYTNSITTDYYIKDANGWQFQFRLKGADGSSPVKGVDYQDGYTPRKGIDYRDGVDGKSTYQLWLAAGNVGTVAQFLASQHGEDGKGLDGADGAKIFDETYAPDDATGKDGDEWYHSKSLTAYDRYFKIAGKWKLRYSGTGTGTVVTPPANAKPVIVFNAPASGATVTVGQALTLTATATDDVSVATVEFLNGTTGASLGMGNKNGSTYTVGYTPTAAGSLSLVAKATDGAGLSDQATVNITVQTAAVSAPAISSFSPATAAVDASVTISGTNFGANQGTSSTVKFNGILANVLSWSDTTIVAKVPTGGATGKITVITASGTAISAATFTVGATNNKVQLFIIGDSITMGAQQGGPGSGNTYPEVVASKLNAASNRFTLFQRGYPSMNARWFINNELQNVLNEFDPITYGGGIMVVTFFGANDLVLYDAPGQPATNHTVQGVYNTNVELHNTFRAGGAKTVIVPILNRVDSYGQAPYSTTFNNDRLAVNDLYFNNRVAFANELADLRNQGNLYPSNAPANPTYFADGVHPTTAGAALIGQEVANAVARYYGLNLAGGGTGATMPPIQNPQNLTWTALVNTANAPARLPN